MRAGSCMLIWAAVLALALVASTFFGPTSSDAPVSVKPARQGAPAAVAASRPHLDAQEAPRAAGRDISPDVAARIRIAQPHRRAAVERAFLHAWNGYRDFAWGTDELQPIQQRGSDSFGMGLTLVDSLDTMLLMGLTEQFDEALEWVSKKLVFGHQGDINLFETTIRILGGLLSAYELSGAEKSARARPLLAAAEALGERLLIAFDSPTGVPYGTVNLKTGRKFNPSWSKGTSCIAEVATLQLEWRVLTRHTGNRKFERAAEKVMRHLRRMKRPGGLPNGLYPTFISPTSGNFVSHAITLGARADSAYEYLLKQWLLSGKTDSRVRAMYETSIEAIAKHLVRHGGADTCANCTYIGQLDYHTGLFKHQMDHLVCFVPGMLALGARGDSGREHMRLAEEMMETCYRMYSEQPTGLAPEIAAFHGQSPRVEADKGATHHLLRPEVVESLFVLWRKTGDRKYREWGWHIFEAIEKHCKVAGGGYTGLKDVTKQRGGFFGAKGAGGGNAAFSIDKMESFFTAETLKYLYLLFADDRLVPLDRYVFNTEAHPFEIHEAYGYGNEYGALPEPEDLKAEMAQMVMEGRGDVAKRVSERSQFCSKHAERCA